MLRKWHETLQKYSNKIAITYLEGGSIKKMSYGELENLSETLSNSAELQHLNPETLVGVFADPSTPAWMISILAIWKRGGAVLLLNSDLGESELAYRLSNVNCEVVIVCIPDPAPDSRRILQSLKGCINFNVSLQQNMQHPIPAKKSNHPDELAYVAYTSGSTGKPKAIAITHAGIVPLTDSHLRFFDDGGSHDVILQDSSLDFDPCWMQFFLVCSGIPCLQWDRLAIPLTTLPALAQEHGVTTVMWVLSNFAELDPHQFPGLRLIFTIGEACTAEYLARWSKPPCKLILTYGPSESTVGCGLSLFQGKIHLGKPTDGMTFQILSKKKLKPLKPTRKGQLALSGPGLARGYLQNGKLVDEIQSESHPKLKNSRSRFTMVAGTRVFLTGDWVVQDKQGDFLFNGRQDRQIKIRGKRIEVFAVEQSINLALHPLELRIIPHNIVKNGLNKYDYLVACIIAPPDPFPCDPAKIISTINKECPHLSEIPKEWYIIRDRKFFSQKKSGKFDYQKLSQVLQDETEKINRFVNLATLCAEPRRQEDSSLSLQDQISAVIRQVIDPLCADADIPSAYFDDLAGKSSLLWTALMNALEQRFNLVLQCHRRFQLNFQISELVQDVALQILFSKAWVKSASNETGGGKRTTLFCCPPVSGDPRNFNKIHWKIAVTTYGLMMPPLFATRAKLADETELAAADRQAAYRYYVEHKSYERLDLIAQYAFLAMRNIQASGPYFICGYSWGGQLAFEIAVQLQKNQFELGYLGILDAAYPGVLLRLQEPEVGMQLLRELYTQIFVFIAKRETFKIQLLPEFEPGFDVNASPVAKLATLYHWLQTQFLNKEVTALASPAQTQQCQQFFESIYWNILAALHYRPDTQLETYNNVTVFHTEPDNDRTCMSAYAPEWQKHFRDTLSLQLIPGVNHLELLENQEFAIRLSTALQRCHSDNTTQAKQGPCFVSIGELQRMHWNIPTARSPYVKRPKLDQALLTALPCQGRHVARTVFFDGFGGLGKSNTLNNFLMVSSDPFGPHYEVIIFFNYSECTDFVTILKNLLQERLPSENGNNLTLTSALRLFYGNYLKSIKGRTLVVFDNVIDNDDILPLIGTELREGSYCDVLVATRNGYIPTGSIPIHISKYPFTRENAIELISQHPNVKLWPLEDKHRLCDCLENYPLGLDMAAAYCDKQNHSADEYIKKLDYLLTQFLGNAAKPAIGLDRKYHQTVTSIVLTTIDNMNRDENPMLMPLMNVISLLDPTNIGKKSLFHAMCAYFQSQKLAPFHIEFRFETALLKLRQFNLVEPKKSRRFIEDTGWELSDCYRIQACHVSVTSIYREVQRKKIIETLSLITENFEYPPFDSDNNDSVLLYQRESMSFLSQFLSACLKFGITLSRSAIKSAESLFKFISISCNSTPLLHELAVLLVEVIKDKFIDEPQTESSAALYGIVLTYLANFISLEEDLSPLACETFEFILKMPLPAEQKQGVRALYLKQLTRYHSAHDPLVLSLTEELVLANPNSYLAVTATAELHARLEDYFQALPLYIAIFQMHRNKHHNKRELAVSLLSVSTCANKLGKIHTALELGKVGLQLASDYFMGECNPNYWKNYARFLEIMIECEQVDIVDKTLKENHDLIKYVQVDEIANHFLNSGEIELVPNCLSAITQREKVSWSSADCLVVIEPIVPDLQIILAKLYFSLGNYQGTIQAISAIYSPGLDLSALVQSKAISLRLCAQLCLGEKVPPIAIHTALSITLTAYHEVINPDYALILYHLALFIANHHPRAIARAIPFLEKAIHIYKSLCKDVAYPPLGRCYVLHAKIQIIARQQRSLFLAYSALDALSKADALFDKVYGISRIHPDKIEAGLTRCDFLIAFEKFTDAHAMVIILNNQNDRLAVPRPQLKREINRRSDIIAAHLTQKTEKSRSKTYSHSDYNANLGLLFSPQMHQAVRVPPSEHPGGLIMTKGSCL